MSCEMALATPEMALFEDSFIQLCDRRCGHQCCTTAVCIDIWKKFELEDALLTPPISPTPSFESDTSGSLPIDPYQYQQTDLEAVSTHLSNVMKRCDHNLNPMLNQDPLWCGQSSNQSPTTAGDTPAPPSPSPGSLSDDELPYTDSVEPNEVLPLKSQFRHLSSDSDEEIDVVTVEKRSLSLPDSPVSSPMKKKQRLMASVPSSPNPQSTGSRYRRTMSHQRRRMSKVEVERRASHNVLERKRRNDLKSYYNVLREVVPELEQNDKASKVQILEKAALYIQMVREQEAMLVQQKRQEQQQRDMLQHKLKKLMELYSSK